MQTIHYSTGRLVLSLIAGVAMVFVGFMLVEVAHGKLAFASWIIALLGPPLALGSVKLLLGDRVALRFDRQRVFIATMWRKRDLLWSEVEEISVKTVTTYGAYGLIKTGSSRSLVIAAKGGLFGTTKLDLSENLLELDSAGLDGIVEQLERARVGGQVMQSAVPQAAPARDFSRRASLEGAPRSADFHPDEAVARYTARRAQTPTAMPARPSFGRKAA
jgi:hypothetical protein